MSYESKILQKFNMPARQEVEQALLQALLRHGGVIREFASGQEIVREMANKFSLNEEQRSACLETTYRKENRVKKSNLWHRLLFRAADSLAKKKLVSRPTQTAQLTKKNEWMLTERGFDQALNNSHTFPAQKALLPTKSYEVQKVVKKLVESRKPENYDPFDHKKKAITRIRKSAIRTRAFRQAVIDAYDHRCAVCKMKIHAPDFLSWEVEAAHIVPHSWQGRDDIWNGLALCHLHHWAFDVGWLTLKDDYIVDVSPKITSLPPDYGIFGNYEFLRVIRKKTTRIFLPNKSELQPDQNAIRWHRHNIFKT